MVPNLPRLEKHKPALDGFVPHRSSFVTDQWRARWRSRRSRVGKL